MRPVAISLALAAALAAGCAEGGPMQRGDRHYARGEYVDAIYEYGQVLDAEDNPDAALRRACAYHRMGHAESAAADLARAARCGSPEARALVAAGPGHADPDALGAVAEARPDKAWPWALYGDALLEADRPDEAAAAYDRALGLDPGPDLAAGCLYNTALADLHRGDTDAAARHLAAYRGVAAEPEGEAAAYLEGLVAYARGERSDAAAAWARLSPAARARLRTALPGEDDLLAAR